MRVAAILAVVLLLGAGTARAQEEADLPPAGYGTLSQDNLSIRMVVSDLEIRFLPLDERILRLLARDAYESLHRLVDSRRPQIDSVARANGVSRPGLALVSFFGLRPAVQFAPDNLNLVIRNQLYRPIGMVPYTSNFSGRQLDVRQMASAIYLFEQTIPVYDNFEISYGGTTTDAWDGVLTRIQRERARITGRWRRERGDSSASTP